MKYLVYCRKSSEEDDRQIQSIDSQKRELMRLFPSENGIEIVDILEEAQSAMTPGRPVFNRSVTLADTWAKIEKGQKK